MKKVFKTWVENLGQRVITKVSVKIRFLARKALFVDEEVLQMLASVEIRPHLDCVCITWYSSIPRGI